MLRVCCCIGFKKLFDLNLILSFRGESIWGLGVFVILLFLLISWFFRFLKFLIQFYQFLEKCLGKKFFKLFVDLIIIYQVLILCQVLSWVSGILREIKRFLVFRKFIVYQARQINNYVEYNLISIGIDFWVWSVFSFVRGLLKVSIQDISKVRKIFKK